MIRDVTFGAILLVGGEVWATEPPCHYPTCFPASGVQNSFTFRGDGVKLVVHVMGKLDQVDLALVEVTTGGYAESGKLVAGYLVKSADEKFVQFERLTHKGSLPFITFSGSLEKLTSIQIQLTDGGGKLDLPADRRQGRRGDSARIMARYRNQKADQEFASQLDEARQELALTVGKINKACSTDLKWSLSSSDSAARLSPGSLDSGDLKYRCGELIEPLASITCTDGAQQKNVKRDVREIECQFVAGGKSSMTLRDGKLTVKTSLNAPRDGRGSFDAPGFFSKAFQTGPRPTGK